MMAARFEHPTPPFGTRPPPAVPAGDHNQRTRRERLGNCQVCVAAQVHAHLDVRTLRAKALEGPWACEVLRNAVLSAKRGEPGLGDLHVLAVVATADADRSDNLLANFDGVAAAEDD